MSKARDPAKAVQADKTGTAVAPICGHHIAPHSYTAGHQHRIIQQCTTGHLIASYSSAQLDTPSRHTVHSWTPHRTTQFSELHSSNPASAHLRLAPGGAYKKGVSGAGVAYRHHHVPLLGLDLSERKMALVHTPEVKKLHLSKPCATMPPPEQQGLSEAT